MDKARLIVPASTSNLGPGFDTLGLALGWSVRASAEKTGDAVSIIIDHPDYKDSAGEFENVLLAAAAAWARRAGVKNPAARVELAGDVPVARGLGSSAVYRLALCAAMNHLYGGPLDDQGLLDLVSELEDHTDNTAPCLLGGLTVSGRVGGHVRYARFDVPDTFRFVALVPESELPTSKARGVLPDSVPRADAVFSMQRSLLLVDAISRGDGPALRGLFEDRLHQPYRLPLAPFLPRVVEAAERAGAFGAFLSGAGSTVLAVTDAERADAAARAMLLALEASGVKGNTRALMADNQGARLIE